MKARGPVKRILQTCHPHSWPWPKLRVVLMEMFGELKATGLGNQDEYERRLEDLPDVILVNSWSCSLTLNTYTSVYEWVLKSRMSTLVAINLVVLQDKGFPADSQISASVLGRIMAHKLPTPNPWYRSRCHLTWQKECQWNYGLYIGGTILDCLCGPKLITGVLKRGREGWKRKLQTWQKRQKILEAWEEQATAHVGQEADPLRATCRDTAPEHPA